MGRSSKMTPRKNSILKDISRKRKHSFTYEEAAEELNEELRKQGRDVTVSKATIGRYLNTNKHDGGAATT